MTLDLAAVARQLHEAQGLLSSAEERRRARREAAAEALALVRARPELLEIVARPGLPVPQALEPLDLCRAALPAPACYTVAATDGSQIAPDPHGALLYYVINVGRVALHYGPGDAHLDSLATFCCAEDELYVRVGERRELMDDHLLATRRKVAELRELAALVAGQRREGPLVAFQDGSLILTEHESLARAGHVERRLLTEYVAALEDLVAQRVPVLGFISRPRSDIVAGLVRAAVCTHDDATWRAGCGADPVALCARLSGASDRDLLDVIGLESGERSARLRSRWREARPREPWVEVDFFFLHTGSEIARVQLPAAIADDGALLDLCHAVLVDQCHRGGGYPPVLAEAHEQAVIHPGDRRAFAALVDRELAQLGLRATPSAKQWAKTRRAL